MSHDQLIVQQKADGKVVALVQCYSLLALLCDRLRFGNERRWQPFPCLAIGVGGENKVLLVYVGCTGEERGLAHSRS